MLQTADGNCSVASGKNIATLVQGTEQLGTSIPG